MVLETVVAEGLAHLSYLLGDEDAGIAAVIDPRRDVEVYLELARRHHLRITCAVETHIHADFVSGTRELAAATGAEICTPESDAYRFARRSLREGDTLALGDLCLRVLHTPGHTPEHLSLVVSGGDEGEPWAVFTGDTLFANEVGRPDLLGGGTEEPLARQLYHSLHDKLLPLGDGVLVYPAHGEGSPCGARIGARRVTTLGYERRHNPRLQAGSEEAFVHDLLASLPEPPAYYPRVKQVNAEGPRVLGSLPYLPLLDTEEFRARMAAPDAVVLDTREVLAFGGGHIPGATSIALREAFPIWAGRLLAPEQPLLLVLETNADADRVQRHLLRVGLEQIDGILRRGMHGWAEAGLQFERIRQVSIHELREWLNNGHADDLQIVDVRSDAEWRQGHIPGAIHLHAAHLTERMDELDRARPVVVYCGSGYRATTAASILQRSGFRDVSSVPGSIHAWRAAGYPLVQ